LEPEDVKNYLKNGDKLEYLSVIKNIDTIVFDKSINMFHDLNDLIYIFYEKFLNNIYIMRYLKSIFENDLYNQVDEAELKDFCETYLAYLLDDTSFKIEVIDTEKWDSYIIWLGKTLNPRIQPFRWDEIKDYYIPFVKLQQIDLSKVPIKQEVFMTDEAPTMLCQDKQKNDAVKDIIAKLKEIEVDGETMQYILEQVGMDEQMLKQLFAQTTNDEIDYLHDVRNGRG
jgi:hypothetical protein